MWVYQGDYHPKRRGAVPDMSHTGALRSHTGVCSCKGRLNSSSMWVCRGGSRSRRCTAAVGRPHTAALLYRAVPGCNREDLSCSPMRESQGGFRPRSCDAAPSRQLQQLWLIILTLSRIEIGKSIYRLWEEYLHGCLPRRYGAFPGRTQTTALPSYWPFMQCSQTMKKV